MENGFHRLFLQIFDVKTVNYKSSMYKKNIGQTYM